MPFRKKRCIAGDIKGATGSKISKSVNSTIAKLDNLSSSVEKDEELSNFARGELLREISEAKKHFLKIKRDILEECD